MRFTMPAVVLYRESLLDGTPELASISRHLIAANDIDSIGDNATVFPRFRSIPFGQLLEEDVTARNGRLINSWEQHQYISNLFTWIDDLSGITPPAYRASELNQLPDGEYFIKGETNSAKHEWSASAFAPTIDAAQEIVERLRSHSVIGNQEIVIRPFIRYRTLATMESGQPVFNERRVFVLNGKVMADGFYWSKQTHRFRPGGNDPLLPDEFSRTVNEAIKRIGGKASFVVIDLAERRDGTWDVIELNDANMSGLCGVDPDELWRNVAKSIGA